MISKIFDGSIIKFKDRQTASEVLCSVLKSKLTKMPCNEVLILGIPRGGIIVGDIVAKKFGYPFNVVIPRRILAPHNKELSIGAIMKDNTIYFNKILLDTLGINQDYLDVEKKKEIREIEKRETILGRHVEFDEINGKNIILVDDGVASGATLIVTSRWVRKFKPKSLTILVPVCPKPILKLLKHEVDQVESILTPTLKNFTSIDSFYQNFKEVEYDELNDILKNY